MPQSHHHPIQSALLDCCQSLTEQSIIIACSGGVDSIVLLDELARLRDEQLITQSLRVIYIHHGISQNADSWQAFVESACADRQLEFLAIKVTLEVGEGLEDSARRARYAAFAQQATKNSVVFTAHHQDDQVETFLLALKRGAGVKGLGAMQSQTTLTTAHGKVTIVRPLLSISRQQIEQRAKALSLTWIEDESNADNRFDRNFIRNQVLPLLSVRWPSFNQTVSRSAEHCQQTQQLIDEVAKQDLTGCIDGDVRLKVDALLLLSEQRRNLVFRQFLKRSPITTAKSSCT